MNDRPQAGQTTAPFRGRGHRDGTAGLRCAGVQSRLGQGSSRRSSARCSSAGAIPTFAACSQYARSGRVGEIGRPRLHQDSPSIEQVRSSVGRLDLALDGMAKHASATSCGWPASPHQSRNDDRNPCGTARMHCSRSSFDSVASESGLPVTDGTISPSPCESRRASASTATARGASGPLCSHPVLERSARMVQIPESRSTSRHSDSRTSPDRHAVRTRNSKTALVPGQAPLFRTVSIAAAMSPCGKAAKCRVDRPLRGQGRVECGSGGIVRPVTLGHYPVKDPAEPLLDAAQPRPANRRGACNGSANGNSGLLPRLSPARPARALAGDAFHARQGGLRWAPSFCVR